MTTPSSVFSGALNISVVSDKGLIKDSEAACNLGGKGSVLGLLSSHKLGTLSLQTKDASFHST